MRCSTSKASRPILAQAAAVGKTLHPPATLWRFCHFLISPQQPATKFVHKIFLSTITCGAGYGALIYYRRPQHFAGHSRIEWLLSLFRTKFAEKGTSCRDIDDLEMNCAAPVWLNLHSMSWSNDPMIVLQCTTFSKINPIFAGKFFGFGLLMFQVWKGV